MSKLIRPTYPTEINIFILTIIFLLSCFFSHEMFEIHFRDPDDTFKGYPGMILIGVAVVLMVLIVWEEILFQVKLQPIEGGLIFRNHQTKLITQLVIYGAITAIFAYIYFQYQVKLLHFIIWVAVCMVPPVIDKIISGINNYFDFLKLTDTTIAYKNNELEGSFNVKDLQSIVIVHDRAEMVHKIELFFLNDEKVTIDIDEMELEAFYIYIYEFISTHYKDLLTEVKNTLN